MTYTLKVYCAVLYKSFVPGNGSLARHSLKRLCMMLLFVPPFFALQAFHFLCLALDRLLFPAFTRVEIKDPLFIVGVPRSGTTFLHRLLAKDSGQFTTMRTWELFFAPAICQKLFWIALWKLDKLLGGQGEKVLRKVDRALFSSMDDIHPISLFDAEEDFIALCPVMGCFLLVLAFPQESLWRLCMFDQKVPANERARIMSFYRGIIQRHLYVYGAQKRYLSKNPSFTPMLASLQNEFPDASFFACVRHPQQAVPSLLNSMIEGAKSFEIDLDSGVYQQKLLDQMAHYYRYLNTILGRHSTRFIEYQDLVASPRQTVRGLCQEGAYDYSAVFDALLQVEEEKARTYKSAHHYSLEKFGLDDKALHAMMPDVYERYGYEVGLPAHAA